MPALSYPPTRRVDLVEEHHGELVPDPYRWLEETDDPEVRQWAAAQATLTESVLSHLPDRPAIAARLAELWRYERLGVPFHRQGHWFQHRQSGDEDQPVLYRMTSPTDAGEPFLDPRELRADGTASVMHVEPSLDGELVAYARADAGSDWLTWRVRRTVDRVDLPDVVAFSKFSSVAWLPDGSGFVYVGLDPPSDGRDLLAESRHPRIRLHRLGTPQSDDPLLYVEPTHPDWLFSVKSTADRAFLLIDIHRGTFPEHAFRVIPMDDVLRATASPESEPGGPLARTGTMIGEGFVSDLAFVGHDGRSFYFWTDQAAPLGRVVAVSLDRPEPVHWRDVVPEGDQMLEGALLGRTEVAGIPTLRLLCHRLRDARSVLEIWSLGTETPPTPGARLVVVPLDDDVAVNALEVQPDDTSAMVGLTSFVDPGSIWSVDLSSGEATCLRRLTASHAVDLVTEQVFVEADDGVRIPVTLLHRPDLDRDGARRTLLYGYGGFNIPVLPQYSPAWIVWAERGGLLAVANLRGGGEYGRAWHDAGRLANKQRVFDDAVAVAQALIADGWTRPDRLAITGRSNGGLLAAACLVQHPELWGAVVPEVGVLDLLRFHLFTIGWAWTSDYGNPDDPEQYRWVRAYSPLHGIRPGQAYPPTLVTTGDHDDRVVPGHSFKFAAALQAAQAGDAPILLRVDTSAGHGAGKPTSKLVAERADVLSFLESALSGQLRELLTNRLRAPTS